MLEIWVHSTVLKVMCWTQEWVKDMADFVKSVDPNHLVMVGTWGYFGQSSPEMLAENPYDLSWRTVNGSNNAGIWSAGDHQIFL